MRIIIDINILFATKITTLKNRILYTALVHSYLNKRNAMHERALQGDLMCSKFKVKYLEVSIVITNKITSKFTRKRRHPSISQSCRHIYHIVCLGILYIHHVYIITIPVRPNVKTKTKETTNKRVKKSVFTMYSCTGWKMSV